MMRTGNLWAGVRCMLAFAAAGAAQGQTTQGQSAIGLSSCRLERPGLPAAFADCATLAVAENPAEPGAGTLDLFVARIPSRSATPAADPLLLINGGPGGSGVDLYLQARNAFAPTLLDRDIVIVDQRGTGRSVAGLNCETPDDLELETASEAELRAAVEQCITEFPTDPGFFTTSIAVRDLEAVRAALGVESWNLYGVSYGTRVVQHYLRRYPERVRAAILDGVVPAGMTLGPDIARDAQAALDAVLGRCAVSESCSAVFGDITGKFETLLARFSGDSIEVMIDDPSSGQPKLYELAELQLQSVVRLMSYADATAALLPLVIDEAYKGNYAPLAAQADLLIESVSESIGFAMHNSIVCTEDVPFFPAAAPLQEPAPYLGTTIVDSLRTICEVWPTGLLDDDFREPVVSDRPVLLLSGENDPVTPPDYAERVAAGLSDAVHIVGRGKGHGMAAVGCTPRLIRDFLAEPDPSAVDAGCLDVEGPMPFFVSFQGPAP